MFDEPPCRTLGHSRWSRHTGRPRPHQPNGHLASFSKEICNRKAGIFTSKTTSRRCYAVAIKQPEVPDCFAASLQPRIPLGHSSPSLRNWASSIQSICKLNARPVDEGCRFLILILILSSFSFLFILKLKYCFEQSNHHCSQYPLLHHFKTGLQSPPKLDQHGGRCEGLLAKEASCLGSRSMAKGLH